MSTDDSTVQERRFFARGKRIRMVARVLLIVVLAMTLAPLFGFRSLAQKHAKADKQQRGIAFASSNSTPLLQFPEGITSWNGVVYAATYNVINPQSSVILAFNAANGKVMRTIGGPLISAGALLGLTIDPSTGYLYAAGNFTGDIYQIINPTSKSPKISIYAQYPAGGGPEDLVFNEYGVLYATDSNSGLVYEIPPGGGQANLIIGPPGSGAPVSDNGLLQSPVAGLSPNGIVFSLDWRTLFVANTWSDSIIAFDVDSQGQVTGNPRIFAQHLNDDLEEYPTGFDALVRQDTKIGPSASTPLNGPDGLALDSQGNVWVASNLGDNLTVLDGHSGSVIATFGQSAVTSTGLLNQPSGMTFVNSNVYCSNLGIFTGLAGSPQLPFLVVKFHAGVHGAGGNGNY